MKRQIDVRITERPFASIGRGGYVEPISPRELDLDCVEYRGFDRQGERESWAAWLNGEPGILSYEGHYEGAPVPGNVRTAQFTKDESGIYNVPTRAQKNWR